MGAAYRASGLTGPVMDALVFHPYPENSGVPPTLAHPNTTPLGIADYAKLVGLLARPSTGPAQPGSTLPILYGEYGIETQIPAAKASEYTGTEAVDDKPAPESTQGSYYRQAMAMAFCQPNVVGLLIFHAFDETALDRFQSGLYYPDQTPKSSLATVRSAARDVHGGVIAKCQGLELTPTAKVGYPRIASIAAGTAAIGVTCDIDCTIFARLEKLPKHSTTLVVRAAAKAGERTLARIPPKRLAPGRYRFTVRLERAGEQRRAARARQQDTHCPLAGSRHGGTNDRLESRPGLHRLRPVSCTCGFPSCSMRPARCACRRTRRSGASAAAQPKPLMVGAAEDAAKEGGALEADAKMSLARLAGFDTIRDHLDLAARAEGDRRRGVERAPRRRPTPPR